MLVNGQSFSLFERKRLNTILINYLKSHKYSVTTTLKIISTPIVFLQKF